MEIPHPPLHLSTLTSPSSERKYLCLLRAAAGLGKYFIRPPISVQGIKPGYPQEAPLSIIHPAEVAVFSRFRTDPMVRLRSYGRPMDESALEFPADNQGRQVQQDKIKGIEIFLSVTAPESLFKLRQGDRVFKAEGTNSQASQGFHHCSSTQGFSQVMSQGTDIGAFATYYVQCEYRGLPGGNFQTVYLSRPAFTLYFNTSPCQLIEGLSVVFESTVHGGSLEYSTAEPVQGGLHHLTAYAAGIYRANNLTGDIKGISSDTKLHLCPVMLGLVKEVFNNPGGFTEANRQDSAGQRVQCTGMSGMAFSSNALHPRDNAERGQTLGFINVQDPIHLSSLQAGRRTASRVYSFSSSEGDCSERTLSI
jgi:hypothetical protein